MIKIARLLPTLVGSVVVASCSGTLVKKSVRADGGGAGGDAPTNSAGQPTDSKGLAGESFSDITPLETNPGLGSSDFVDITNIGNVFCNNTTITLLEGHGVNVAYDNNC